MLRVDGLAWLCMIGKQEVFADFFNEGAVSFPNALGARSQCSNPPGRSARYPSR
jgi:hypothetical protein